jgi:hypothetical protein
MDVVLKEWPEQRRHFQTLGRKGINKHQHCYEEYEQRNYNYPENDFLAVVHIESVVSIL